MLDAGAGSGPVPTPESGKTFPQNAVVGVIDDPGELLGLVNDTRAAGFEPSVLCGEIGQERMENAGGSVRDLRLTRTVQGLFGYEVEHSDRHMQELADGHFIVVVESRDNSTTDKLRDIFELHDGKFVNYYSSWTSRTLLP